MEHKDFWTLIENTTFAFGPFYQHAMGDAIEATGAPEIWFPLSMAIGAEPKPFNLERYRNLDPYTNPDRQIEILEELTGLGLLQPVDDLNYRLTDKGRSSLKNIFKAAHDSLADVAPLPEARLAELTTLLWRVVQNALGATEPAGKWSLIYSRWTDPGEAASYAARIDQYLTDLSRFRDDCHLAAWKTTNLSGPSLEALTLIWRGDASTAEELAERLSFRSYRAADYAEAVQALVDLGWVLSTGDGYSITPEGNQARQDIEEQTGVLFTSPFTALASQDYDRLVSLLQRLNKHLVLEGRLVVWDLMYSLSSAVSKASRQALDPVIEQHGLNQPGYFFTLFRALQFDPQPISTDQIHRQSPYFNRDEHTARLERVAEAGLLERTGDGDYRLTARARTAMGEVNDAFYLLLGELPVFTPERTEMLEGLLQKLVDASLEAREPETKMRLALVNGSHPTNSYSQMARIDMHIDDLNAFRDDSHIAAWKSLDVSPEAWEAFTFVWRGKANDGAGLAKELPFRGFSAEHYEKALKSLETKGWLNASASGYELTEAGAVVRQQAEDETNRLFFAPWEAIRPVDVNRLRFLLSRLRKELEELEPAKETAP